MPRRCSNTDRACKIPTVMETLRLHSTTSEKYTPHYARHTCATMMREANIPDDLRKAILGHANGDITARYTHLSDAMLLETIDRLPGRI